jgi:hypothetical protein
MSRPRGFGLRLFRMRLLEEDDVRSVNDKADLHVEPEDLVRPEEEPDLDPAVFLPNPNRKR